MSTTIDDIAFLSEKMKDAQAEVDQLEVRLKFAKERLRVITEETIPGVMAELGLSSLSLDSGEKLIIKKDVYASVPAENKKKVYGWLDDHSFGGLIKVNVVTAFDKNQRLLAVGFYKSLKEKGFSVELSESIHAKTLNAFLREQLAAGNDIPLDLFGARPVSIAKFK